LDHDIVLKSVTPRLADGRLMDDQSGQIDRKV